MKAWLIFLSLAVVAAAYGVLWAAVVAYFGILHPSDGFLNQTMVLMVEVSLLATFLTLSLLAIWKRPY